MCIKIDVAVILQSLRQTSLRSLFGFCSRTCCILYLMNDTMLVDHGLGAAQLTLICVGFPLHLIEGVGNPIMHDRGCGKPHHV